MCVGEPTMYHWGAAVVLGGPPGSEEVGDSARAQVGFPYSAYSTGTKSSLGDERWARVRSRCERQGSHQQSLRT